MDPDRVLFFLKKVSWTALVFGGLFWLGSWFFMSGASQDLRDWSYSKIDNVAVNSGLSIKNILIEGRYYTTVSNLKQAISLEKGDSLLAVKPAILHERLISLPWVQQAYIKKIWPDTISITLEERLPMALYQVGKEVHLLDNKGEIIGEHNLTPYRDLIIISGNASTNHAVELFSLITANKSVYDEIERAVYISERRWDLILKNETEIKLPENDVAFALKILEDAEEQDSILSKNLEIIDLRDPNRIVVKTRPGQLQNYSLSEGSAGNNI